MIQDPQGTSPNGLEQNESTSKLNRFLETFSLKRAGAFLGILTAVGGLVGVLIGVNKWYSEKPNVEVEISQIDLVSYISASNARTLNEKTLPALNKIEVDYSDITDDHIVNLMRDTYNLFVYSNEVAIKHPDQSAEESTDSYPKDGDYLVQVRDSFAVSIKNLTDKKNKASGDVRKRYEELIARLTEEQKKIQDVESMLKISLVTRVENKSQLSNYMDSQAVLLFHKGETEFASVPQLVLEIKENENNPNAGRVEGYGVSSLIFEAEVDSLEKDNQDYVDLAFRKRAEGDEDYHLMLVIEDIKGNSWSEEALFSTFTQRSIKQDKKVAAGKVFESRDR